MFLEYLPALRNFINCLCNLNFQDDMPKPGQPGQAPRAGAGNPARP